MNKWNNFTARDVTINISGDLKGSSIFKWSAGSDSRHKQNSSQYVKEKSRGNIIVNLIVLLVGFLADLFSLVEIGKSWLVRFNETMAEMVAGGTIPLFALFPSLESLFHEPEQWWVIILSFVLILLGLYLVMNVILAAKKCYGISILRGTKVYRIVPSKCHCGGRMKYVMNNGIRYVQCVREKSHTYLVDITQMM